MHTRFAGELAATLSALAALTILSSVSAPVRASGVTPPTGPTVQLSTRAAAFTVEGNRGEVQDFRGLGKGPGRAPGGRRFRAKPGEKLFLRGLLTLPAAHLADAKLVELTVRFRTSPDGPSLRAVELLNGSHREFRIPTLLKGDFRQAILKPENRANAWAFEPVRVGGQTFVRLEVQYPIGFDTVIDPGEFMLYSVDARFPGMNTSPPPSPTPVPPPSAPAPGSSSGVTATDAVIYAVAGNDDLLWYNHSGRADGTFSWTSNVGRTVGTGWSFTRVFPGDNGVVYGITGTGDLMWYRHVGRGDGTFTWSDAPKRVGTGWQFEHVFPGGDGVIYAINADGHLLWYRHEGRDAGTLQWSGPRQIGTGWNFAHVFAGDGGVIYAITESGDLLWYRHEGRADGTARWTAHVPKRVGTGWNFPHVFAAGGGVIYVITETGDLLWYRHDGFADGSERWAAQEGRKVGTGWTVKRIFSGANVGG